MPGHHRSLTLWMSLTIAVFVLVGSLALWLVFEQQAQREERAAFQALAKANAAFLDRTPLPQSNQMAAQLGEVMGVRVFFKHPGTNALVGKSGDALPEVPADMPADGQVQTMADRQWLIAHDLRNGSRVYFARQAPSAVAALARSGTWIALATFWLLSVGLGVWLAQRVSIPLRTLTAALPRLGTDDSLPAIPLHRRDEIGQLAGALQRTHEALQDEREKRKAAERLAIMGRMAASLAHEVRNPVAAIQLHAQLLEGASPEDAAESRALIESEAARIESLVRQWMLFARPAPPVLAAIDLTAVIKQAIAVLSPQADHAAVKINADGVSTSAPLIVSGDGERLLQVLQNLLRNAIQAMPTGGALTIHAVTIDAQKVRIRIEDEGTGFSPAAMERAREAFFSEREGGMGLGLAVASEICHAHGGSLSLSNRETGGARVEIILPAGQSAASSALS